MYKITLESERDYETLLWLSDRGYDAGIWNLSEITADCDEDGDYVFTMTLEISEPDAWAIQDEIERYPTDFLACCGSDTLSASLLEFMEEIV